MENNGAGPQIKRRETWVDLPDEYEGFKFKVWVNAPARVWNELNPATSDEASDEASDEEAAAREAAAREATAQAAPRQIVLEHNGWRDFDGQPFPPADDPAFWEAIPTELAACVLVAARVEMGKLPNSIAPQRRRSRRG